MTVFYDKDRGRWRYDFRLAGTRYARECLNASGEPASSRRAAIDIEAEAKRQARIAPKLPRANEITFIQVMNDLSEGWMRRPGWNDRQRMVKELVAFFGPATPMRDIDGARIQDYITFALSKPLRVWKGGPSASGPKNETAARWKAHPTGRTRSPSTVNRYLPLLRAAFERAYNTRDPITRERAIEEVPVIKELAEPRRKARPVPEDVLGKILARLPEHVADAVKATLYFGFRRSEVFSLTIAQVDFHARGIRLRAENVKDAEDVFLPGGNDAMQFLARLVDQAKDRKTQYLFTWRQPFKDEARQAREPWRRIRSPKTAWRTAMKAIEAETGARWRWHDIRAAFITHVAVTSGQLAAQAMARHSDYKTTQDYVEVADEVTRAAADRVSNRPALGIVKGGKG